VPGAASVRAVFPLAPPEQLASKNRRTTSTFSCGIARSVSRERSQAALWLAHPSMPVASCGAPSVLRLRRPALPQVDREDGVSGQTEPRAVRHLAPSSSPYDEEDVERGLIEVARCRGNASRAEPSRARLDSQSRNPGSNPGRGASEPALRCGFRRSRAVRGPLHGPPNPERRSDERPRRAPGRALPGGPP
jgi:hypothetical protein